MPEPSAVTETAPRLQLTRIVHPTDCSEYGTNAFAHALRIAIATKANLSVLHIPVAEDAERQLAFPRSQRLLAQWGLIEENDSAAVIPSKLGTHITDITLDARNPVEGISRFIGDTTADLVVMATLGRDGLEHWLKGSIAESAFRRFSVPTLFINSRARGFVQQVSGDVRLRRVLIPVDRHPSPNSTIESVRQFCRTMTGRDAAIDLLHVGNSAPVINDTTAGDPLPVITRYGNVVESILNAALEYDVDLIAMPTAGPHGVLDALRGSTTQRVLRHAPCPVYAVPTGRHRFLGLRE